MRRRKPSFALYIIQCKRLYTSSGGYCEKHPPFYSSFVVVECWRFLPRLCFSQSGDHPGWMNRSFYSVLLVQWVVSSTECLPTFAYVAKEPKINNSLCATSTISTMIVYNAGGYLKHFLLLFKKCCCHGESYIQCNAIFFQICPSCF